MAYILQPVAFVHPTSPTFGYPDHLVASPYARPLASNSLRCGPYLQTLCSRPQHAHDLPYLRRSPSPDYEQLDFQPYPFARNQTELHEQRLSELLQQEALRQEILRAQERRRQQRILAEQQRRRKLELEYARALENLSKQHYSTATAQVEPTQYHTSSHLGQLRPAERIVFQAPAIVPTSSAQTQRQRPQLKRIVQFPKQQHQPQAHQKQQQPQRTDNQESSEQQKLIEELFARELESFINGLGRKDPSLSSSTQSHPKPSQQNNFKDSRPQQTPSPQQRSNNHMSSTTEAPKEQRTEQPKPAVPVRIPVSTPGSIPSASAVPQSAASQTLPESSKKSPSTATVNKSITPGAALGILSRLARKWRLHHRLTVLKSLSTVSHSVTVLSKTHPSNDKEARSREEEALRLLERLDSVKSLGVTELRELRRRIARRVEKLLKRWDDQHDRASSAGSWSDRSEDLEGVSDLYALPDTNVTLTHDASSPHQPEDKDVNKEVSEQVSEQEVSEHVPEQVSEQDESQFEKHVLDPIVEVEIEEPAPKLESDLLVPNPSTDSLFNDIVVSSPIDEVKFSNSSNEKKTGELPTTLNAQEREISIGVEENHENEDLKTAEDPHAPLDESDIGTSSSMEFVSEEAMQATPQKDEERPFSPPVMLTVPGNETEKTGDWEDVNSDL